MLFAHTIFIILVVIRMKVLAQKRAELFQMTVSLIGSLRTEKGCLCWDIFQSIEDKNEPRIFEERDTRKNQIKRYLAKRSWQNASIQDKAKFVVR